MAHEIWTPVVGFEGLYEASSLGRIRNARTGYVRKSHCKRGTDYQLVTLMDGSAHNTRSLHRLIAEAFIGPRPQGMQCCHLNGDPRDNRVENLAYVTPKENNAHKYLHGTEQTGERHHAAKLTEEIVLEMRRAIKTWPELAPAADRLGIDREALYNAVRGKTWRHLPHAVKLTRTRNALTVEDVRYIRSQRGIKSRIALAAELGTGRRYISDIWARRKWGALD